LERYFYHIIFLLVFGSCKIIDPPEKIPSYIYIEDIEVSTSPNEGSSNDNIIDAWIFVNGTHIGTYELPAKIPVIADGAYELEVFAGIKRSGLTALRSIYPFYNSYQTTLQSNPNTIDTILPVVTYKDIANIWVEDFEDPGVKFTSDTISDTVIQITTIPAEVREGNGSGKIVLNSTQTLFQAQTNEPDFNNFKKGGNPIYVEIEYNTNYPLTIGLLHGDDFTSVLFPEELLTLKPTFGVWKKTYVDFTEIVSTQQAATKYQIYLSSPNYGTDNIEMFIDNIKVIYF